MRLARYSQERGDFASAERGFQRAAAIAEKWFGPDDLRFATVANNLGSLSPGSARLRAGGTTSLARWRSRRPSAPIIRSSQQLSRTSA